ncbi:MAG: hypothetical protein IKS11_01840, partial [Lachnospiraceae bacterium]|nr:hypothetical protein [Lachnospiraceae bacterium]
MPSSFLTALLDWSAVIPAAFLCFAPMKGFLKTPVRTLMLKGTGMLLILLTLMSYIEARFQLMYNSCLAPLLIASFIFFKSHIKASFTKALAVFT